jgi:hypothetical protein
MLIPGSNRDAANIPHDTNPVDVKLTIAKNQLSINAHKLPEKWTLLRIRLNGDKSIWGLWGRIRDELEKLGWFSLPEIPETPRPVRSKNDLQE